MRAADKEIPENADNREIGRGNEKTRPKGSDF